MSHYHVISATGGFTPIYTLRYDNYEDAIQTYVALTTQFFSGKIPQDQLAIEYAMAATDYGSGNGAFIGNEIIALYFIPCEEERCSAPNWN